MVHIGFERRKDIYTLRCTQKLLAKRSLSLAAVPSEPVHDATNALGDWYAHRLIVERQHLAMCVSARSRLCVLTTARDLDGLPQRLCLTLGDLLRALNISEDTIAREQREMSEPRYGLTTGTLEGRNVLGTINDYSRALHYNGLGERDLATWNLHFSKWICGPLGNTYPREAAARLLQEALSRQPLPEIKSSEA